MKKSGYGYSTARNGLEAVEIFKAQWFDAILMGRYLLFPFGPVVTLTPRRHLNAGYGRPHSYTKNPLI